MKLPAPVPELPVTDIQAAADAYARQMGLTVDWTYEDHLRVFFDLGSGADGRGPAGSRES